MEWLNYHHLLYFWTVVREGSVVRAAAALHVSQPTVSAQVRALEAALGNRLFTREGRRLVPTEMGRVVSRYADEIFATGREMLSAVRTGGGTGRPARLVVGVTDVLSKLVAYRLLAPALRLEASVRLVCREDRVERLLGALALHDVDLVLSDTPVPPAIRVQAFSHLLGESPVSLFAVPSLAKRMRQGFPGSLAGAPVLWPGEGTVLRRQLDDWVARLSSPPRIVAEFDDSALLKAFAQHGAGAFAAATVLKRDLREQYGVVPVASLDGLRERFYVITAERRLTHPAILAIAHRAREQTFARPARRR